MISTHELAHQLATAPVLNANLLLAAGDRQLIRVIICSTAKQAHKVVDSTEVGPPLVNATTAGSRIKVYAPTIVTNQLEVGLYLLRGEGGKGLRALRRIEPTAGSATTNATPVVEI